MTNDPGPADPFRPAPSAAPTDETTWVPPTAAAGSGPASGAPADDPFAPHLDPVTPTSPVPAARPRGRPSGAGILVNVLLGIAVVVAVGGVGFAAGRATAPVSTASNGDGGGRFGNGGGPFFGGPNASGAPGNGGFAGGGLGGGGLSIEGTVTAVSADSITIQLASGQSVTIPIDAQTTYHSRQAATAADVTTGSTVQVQLAGGGRGILNGNGNGNNGNGNGNGGPAASGQPTRTLPAAGSITLVPAGS